MIIKRLAFFCCCIFILSHFKAQTEKDGLVNWLSIKEAQQKNKEVQKPFIIDIYTDWCGWCKHMMKTTYSNAGIANYINSNFYPVKFDAETKDTIEYNGKIYKPTSKEPKTPHELAIKFLGTSLSYPSTMFVTNNFEYNLLSQGFIEDKKIEPLLIFMVENAWRNSVYDEFSKHFNRTFIDTNYIKTPVKIYSVSELEKLQKKKPKKVLVNINADFCNTGRVMTQTTFVDTLIASYINKYFYLVNINAASNDTIIFKNEKYFKVLTNNFPLHSLALKFSNNKLSLPTLCLLDENLNTIDALNFYQSPERIKPILAYIGSNSYKTKTFNDFMQEYTKPKNNSTKK
jgi:thioredoxin-related protein